MTQEEVLKIAEEVAKIVENRGDYYLFYSTSCIEFDENNNATFTAYVTNCKDEDSDWEESWYVSNKGEIWYSQYSNDYYDSGEYYSNLKEFKEKY